MPKLPRPKLNLKQSFAGLKKIKIPIHFKKQQKQIPVPPPPPKPLPRGLKVIEKSPLYEPFSQVAIIQNPKTGEYKYILDELQLDPLERGVYERILEILLAEIESPKEEIADPRKFFAEEAKKIVDKYRISLGWLPDVSWYKILYHAERDLVGFGKIDPLMRDPNIEDISCDGVHKSVYIWHRNYESLETNLEFESDEVLDNTVVKLVHKPGSKVITIEETAELNLPHENWVSLISRQSYGLGGSSVGEVALFDLVKTSMRHRPDMLIVGEVRGQEAYVLFQALATGHGGMCTMHAENLASAVKRLTQKPMEISPAYIPLMNVVMSVQRVHIVKNGEKRAYRRVLSVNEIVDSEKFVESFK